MTATSDEAKAILEALDRGETTINDLLGPLYKSGSSALLRLRRRSTPFAVAPEYSMEPKEDPIVQATVKEVGPRHFPQLQEKYDLVAIGAGVAGLLTVIVGKSLGKKCLLVEKHYMGGDCLNVGCFPSKCLIACARKAHELRHAHEFGISIQGSIKVDFPMIMQRMRKLRGTIAPHDGVQRYLRDFCDDIAIASATFVGPSTLELTSKTTFEKQLVDFDKCVICTGASAMIVPILRETPHLTNGNFFNLQELPPRSCLIGAGPIGIEMAQALQRCGSQVTIFEISDHLLPREDIDAAIIVTEALKKDGVDVVCSVEILSVSSSSKEVAYKAPWSLYTLKAKVDGIERFFECEALLNATGRAPNVQGLGLEAAGIDFDFGSGVHVNEYGQTKNPNVYAAGDVCSAYKFTHSADFMARLAVRNAFLDAKSPYSKLLVPWTTYTDPEIAHVGLYEKDIEQCDTYIRYLKDVDRCKCEGITEGFVKITCEKGTDKILGATIVGPNAGDLLSEISVSLQNDIGLRDIAAVMHPYPTTAEAIRQCAAQYLFSSHHKTPALMEALRLG